MQLFDFLRYKDWSTLTHLGFKIITFVEDVYSEENCLAVESY
jgi:hypothetical protein